MPVGTGRAIARITEMTHPLDEYQYDHPDCFVVLEEMLSFLNTLCSIQPQELRAANRVINDWCHASGLKELYEKKVSERPTPRVLNNFLMQWFDGLRTRQFVHHIRDKQHGTMNAASLMRYFDTGHELTDLRKYLFHQIYR